MALAERHRDEVFLAVEAERQRSEDTLHALKEFQRISGVDLGEVVRFRRWDIGQIGGAVRLLMQSPSVLRNLESTAFQLEELAKAARAAASELKTPRPEAA